MDNLNLNVGTTKRVSINNDPNKVIEFDPADTLFAERFYDLYSELLKKQDEYKAIAEDLDARKDEKDENGVPLITGEGIAFLKDVCVYLREKIDNVFGEETSQTVFGDSLNINAITQFLEGLIQFVEPARSQKISKYTKGQESDVMAEDEPLNG